MNKYASLPALICKSVDRMQVPGGAHVPAALALPGLHSSRASQLQDDRRASGGALACAAELMRDCCRLLGMPGAIKQAGQACAGSQRVPGATAVKPGGSSVGTSPATTAKSCGAGQRQRPHPTLTRRHRRRSGTKSIAGSPAAGCRRWRTLPRCWLLPRPARLGRGRRCWGSV